KDPSKRPPDGGVLFRQLDSMRRKLERKAALQPSPSAAATPAAPATADRETAVSSGPATLMSRLMRQELERQTRGGPVQRLLNRPLVLVTLFLLTFGTLVWTFWPVSPESLYRRGAALMASSDPDDWDRAWTEFLEPLQTNHPDYEHHGEMDAFRQRYEARTA